MQSKLLRQEGEARTFLLVLDPGEEVISALKDFAARNNLQGAHFQAIGAFQRITLAYFQREQKSYREIPVNEQVEAAALSGNLSRRGEEVVIHAHAVVSRADGTTLGGHILEGVVWPTLEIVVQDSGLKLERTLREEIGLALLTLDA